MAVRGVWVAVAEHPDLLMRIPCPSCNEHVDQAAPPSRTPTPGNDAWLCLRCPATVCVCCYVQHTEATHPEMYRPHERPTKDGRKNGGRRK